MNKKILFSILIFSLVPMQALAVNFPTWNPDITQSMYPEDIGSETTFYLPSDDGKLRCFAFANLGGYTIKGIHGDISASRQPYSPTNIEETQPLVLIYLVPDLVQSEWSTNNTAYTVKQCTDPLHIL